MNRHEIKANSFDRVAASLKTLLLVSEMVHTWRPGDIGPNLEELVSQVVRPK